MPNTRWFKFDRRSLLTSFASFVSTLSLVRASDGAGINIGQASHNLGPDLTASKRPTNTRLPQTIDLKTLSPNHQVSSIRYSDGTYSVTMASDTIVSFREFDLRIKTDTSINGPAKQRPVLLLASMRKDRAFVIFANPREISAFIAQV